MRQVQFQFTPLREGRHDGFITLYRNNSISIHAPPRGATNQHHAQQEHRGFQFTPLREGRHLTLEEAYKAAIFQFTPLREGRQSLVSADTRFPIFQFTPLREGRLRHCNRLCAAGDFNSRPSARGDMEASVELFASRMNFNSRPSARGDPAAPVCPRPSRPHFNSRPSARGDWRCWEKEPTREEFQFTPLREGRRTGAGCCSCRWR